VWLSVSPTACCVKLMPVVIVVFVLCVEFDFIPQSVLRHLRWIMQKVDHVVF